MEALTKQNGVRLLGKFKKKVKTDLPYLSFYKKKLETHIFFWPRYAELCYLRTYFLLVPNDSGGFIGGVQLEV